MTKRSQRIVLWCMAVLLPMPFFVKGHIDSRTGDDVAFLPGGISRSEGATIRVSGNVVIPGLYHVPSHVLPETVIRLTNSSVRRSLFEGITPYPEINNGDALHFAVDGFQHVKIIKNCMNIKEKMILGIPLDLNTMSVADLIELPGIGVVTAENIVRDRQENGVFRTLEDLKRVPGIGPKKVKLLEPFF